jgi:hypothetical protein
MSASFEKEFYRKRRRFRWGDITKSLVRFAATVVCSALLSVWIDHKVVSVRRHWGLRESPDSPAQIQPYQPSRGGNPAGETEVLYAKHLVEILRVLRADRSIRMIRLEVPSTVLNYQRGLASREDGSTMRLKGRTGHVPIFAVSRSSKKYLEENLVTYIDPYALPHDLVEGLSLPFDHTQLSHFLLVPDLSGTNASSFVIQGLHD